MRILIVEDNQKKLDKLKEYISKEFPDYEITDRQSYNSATKEIVLNYKNYDLMLLDMSMQTYDISEDEMASREAWRHAMVLMATLSKGELLNFNLAAPELLFRLFHEDGVRVYESHLVSIGCRCSPEKVQKIVSALTPEQRTDMTVDGEITMTCQFCNKTFHFDGDSSAEA